MFFEKNIKFVEFLLSNVKKILILRLNFAFFRPFRGRLAPEI